MAPNYSNNNNIASTGSINVDLQLVEDTDITWVYTNKFNSFTTTTETHKKTIHQIHHQKSNSESERKVQT